GNTEAGGGSQVKARERIRRVLILNGSQAGLVAGGQQIRKQPLDPVAHGTMTFGSPMATEGAITPKTVRPKSEVNIRYAAFLEEFLQRRLRALDAYREERSFFCYKF